ncbi:MAG TPA: hypothetical protein VF360_02695 [Candidatus Methanoperedens sp.]
MPAGIRVRGVENPQGFGMINADICPYNLQLIGVLKYFIIILY